MTFQQELEHLLNRHSMDNACNTPDFILAEYMVAALAAYKGATAANRAWRGIVPGDIGLPVTAGRDAASSRTQEEK